MGRTLFFCFFIIRFYLFMFYQSIPQSFQLIAFGFAIRIA